NHWVRVRRSLAGPSLLRRTEFSGRRLEPGQPLTDEGEPRLVDGVHARPATSLVAHQTGVLEDAQVPRRRGPFMREAPRDFACGGRAAKVDRQKDLSPRRVR